MQTNTVKTLTDTDDNNRYIIKFAFSKHYFFAATADVTANNATTVFNSIHSRKISKMCISFSLKKFRDRNCNNNSSSYNTSIIGNRSKDDFCNDETYPWLELDTYNQQHTVYFNGSDNAVDVSGEDFPNELWNVASPTEIIIKSSLIIPVVLWGIFANVSLLYVMKKYRHLRTPTNMILANISTVDLLTLVIYPWVFLVGDFFQNFQFGEFGCKADGWFEFSLLLINVMNLSAISYDRLTAIILPHEIRLTRRGSKIVIIVTWTVCLLISTPLIIFRQYKQRQWKNFLEKYCTEEPGFLSIYWHVLIVMAVWLPLLIMVICYSAIFIKLDRYEQKVLKREHPLSVCYKTRVAKVLFIVVITFIICRMPLTALIFRRSQWLRINITNQVLGADQILWFVARYLIYANAALDPLIYGLTNENFRKAFRSTFLTKVFFPKKKKQPPVEKMCVNVIQPRGPYKTDHNSDRSLIIKSKNSDEFSRERSNEVSQKTDIKNMVSSK